MVTPPALIAPSGRIFLRHPSQMGSVMIFNDRGTWRKVLILDAKYRTNKQFGLYKVNIPEFQRLTSDEYDFHDYLTQPLLDFSPDSWISENILGDPMTSRERCDIWMKYKGVNDQSPYGVITGCPAVQYCRSIQANGTPCDLPNIQTLARIYVDRETIDQMDPTLESHHYNSLRYWTLSNDICDDVWSSTPTFNHICKTINKAGNVERVYHRYQNFSVIPILEL